MGNNFEKGPERIPSRAEVLELLGRFVEGCSITRELLDEQGPYLIKAIAPGNDPNADYVEFRRKGEFGRNSSSATEIHIIKYEDGIPVSSDLRAIYNHGTGAWRELE